MPTLEPVFRYLTHPQARIDREIPVPEWQLSDLGRARVQALARSGWLRGTKHMIASAAKATETAEILATSLGIDFKVRPGMHDYENDRSATGFLESEEFEATAGQFFAHPTKSVRGWETVVRAQVRHRHGGRGRPIRPRRRRRYSLCRPWSCGNFALLSLCGDFAIYATASIASGVSFTVVRRNSRRSLRSKRRPRWMVARLSHITRSPTSHLCT